MALAEDHMKMDCSLHARCLSATSNCADQHLGLPAMTSGAHASIAGVMQFSFRSFQGENGLRNERSSFLSFQWLQFGHDLVVTGQKKFQILCMILVKVAHLSGLQTRNRHEASDFSLDGRLRIALMAVKFATAKMSQIFVPLFTLFCVHSMPRFAT